MTERGRIARWLVPAAPVMLGGCATQSPDGLDHPAFLHGLFHGFTAIPALAASLFSPIRIYAFPNSGFWYDAGFVAGFVVSVTALILLCMARVGGFLTREGS